MSEHFREHTGWAGRVCDSGVGGRVGGHGRGGAVRVHTGSHAETSVARHGVLLPGSRRHRSAARRRGILPAAADERFRLRAYLGAE